mmetsp:Transcript_25956/g.81281  ORF Transcript_25956/g.81281 Transcript_25956/m.81281 type:complete len:204 (-) Transcript_25956:36-647(-)
MGPRSRVPRCGWVRSALRLGATERRRVQAAHGAVARHTQHIAHRRPDEKRGTCGCCAIDWQPGRGVGLLSHALRRLDAAGAARRHVPRRRRCCCCCSCRRHRAGPPAVWRVLRAPACAARQPAGLCVRGRPLVRSAASAQRADEPSGAADRRTHYGRRRLRAPALLARWRAGRLLALGGRRGGRALRDGAARRPAAAPADARR